MRSCFDREPRPCFTWPHTRVTAPQSHSRGTEAQVHGRTVEVELTCTVCTSLCRASLLFVMAVFVKFRCELA
jgi:hypothetical protein